MKTKPKKANAQHGLHRQKKGRCSVLQAVFSVMVFAADTLALLYFLQMKPVIDKMYLQKNKQVQPTARSENPRQKKLPEATLT